MAHRLHVNVEKSGGTPRLESKWVIEAGDPRAIEV